MHPSVGFFADSSSAPDYDPGLDCRCIVCDIGLRWSPIKTICVAPVGGNRSYFFRVHRACWETISESDKSDIESSIIDAHKESWKP